jgi:rhodanese-related sulfurtransferase
VLRQVSAPQLAAMLAATEPPRLLDVREPWEWQIACIAGSHCLPMGQIPQRIDEIERTHPTVVICHHGTRSLQVVAFLQRAGFGNLHNLHGGIDAWARQVDPALAVY